MKKRTAVILMTGILTAAVTGCGGGKGDPTAAETTAAQTTAAQTAATTAAAETKAAESKAAETKAAETKAAAETSAAQEAGKTAEDGTYESKDGWTVRYDPKCFQMKEAAGGAEFGYIGEADSKNTVVISTVSGKQPEELLAEVTKDWGDGSKILRTEGFFPGASGQWGFWRTLNAAEDGKTASRTAIAGEYNGGVLLFEVTEYRTGDDAVDMAFSDVAADLIDSVTYKDFEDQKMYSYVPGTYYLEDEDGFTSTVTLEKDHTGSLSFQDDVDILWGSTELLMADTPDVSYEYTIEGTNLMMNLDGNWLTFRKRLPAYEYKGKDEIYGTVCRYIVDELGSNYAPGDVCIPCPVLTAMDDSDPEDIRVYGNFWVYCFNLEGDELQTQSGGACPGCMHLKKTADGYEVTGLDRSEDGTGEEESQKKIFGDLFEKFHEQNSNEEVREKVRLQVVANYAAANDLDIKAVRDYGWDPVELPAENIDSFDTGLN